jgi:hypothetical protein
MNLNTLAEKYYSVFYYEFPYSHVLGTGSHHILARKTLAKLMFYQLAQTPKMDANYLESKALVVLCSS